MALLRKDSGRFSFSKSLLERLMTTNYRETIISITITVAYGIPASKCDASDPNKNTIGMTNISRK